MKTRTDTAVPFVNVRVPLLDLRAQYETVRQDVRKAVEEVLESQQFIMGPPVAEFERAVAKYVGVAHAIGVSSGTDALLAALMALGVGPGDRVVVPTYSFFATAGVVARLGAIPVFTDIDPTTYNTTAAHIDAAVSALSVADRASVKAIMPVHLFGQCAVMPPILAQAARLGVSVIEDAAQAIGATDSAGGRAGASGSMGCYSFFPSKNLGAIGDAGMVVTNDDALADKLLLLRNHGARPKYHHKIVGGNFRLDSIQAAVLLVKLRFLDAWSEARRARAARYRLLFSEAGLDRPNAIALPPRTAEGGEGHIYNQFVVRTPHREALRAYLTEHNVGTEVYYPVPFHLQECFEHLGYRHGDFPEAERAAVESLALPTYAELTDAQQAYVVERIAAFFDGTGSANRPVPGVAR